MLYRQDICPHCGNEITVKGIKEEQKCKWCRRPFIAKFKKNKGKKWHVTLEPVYFNNY